MKIENIQQSPFSVGKQEESFLAAVQLALKLYDRFLDPLRQEFSLTKLELLVIGFLHNNPQKNTAGEISSLRSLSKGNVSCAVDSLSEKGLLFRRIDEKDRRTTRLELLKAAEPITKKIDAVGKAYKERIFLGFTEAQKSQYITLCEKMLSNMKAFQQETE